MAENGTEKRFKARRFAVLTAAFSGLGLPVTGVIIHMAHGASTPQLKMYFMAHSLLAILFIICCAWHVVLNWGGLKRAFSGGLGATRRLGWECGLALGLNAVIWLLAMAH